MSSLDYQSLIDQYTDRTFVDTVEQTLGRFPAGVSEFGLIKALRDQGYFPFLEPAPATPQALFGAHFLLFHALYRLRDRALKQQRGILEINVLHIAWRDYRVVESAIDKPDKMRQYYSDVSNLIRTTTRDVDKLIATFWSRFQKTDERTQALAALGLNDPVDEKSIKMAYRRMVMKHHPDRGGDKEQLQIVNAALERLLKSEKNY